MSVSVDDRADAHARLVGHAQVWFYVTHRIDNGARGAAAAAKQVGDCNGIGVKELAQDHSGLRCGASIMVLIDFPSINIVIDP
jgi:hypothetical protein